MRTYALLVQRLAAAPRVADAIMIIDYVSRAGASSMDEVIFQVRTCVYLLVRFIQNTVSAILTLDVVASTILHSSSWFK